MSSEDITFIEFAESLILIGNKDAATIISSISASMLDENDRVKIVVRQKNKLLILIVIALKFFV
jgi:uncharacterized protein YqfB (UPF0267 family)